jgi:CubicO group peptidase (beta-lactamase class C family)
VNGAYVKQMRQQIFALVMSLGCSFTLGESQTGVAKDLARQHRTAVEHNLLYQTMIKGAPDAGMSLQEQMTQLHVPGVSIAAIHNGRMEWTNSYGVIRLGGPPVTAETLFNAASHE